MKKHLTIAEKEARQVAEGELQRKKRPQIRCPKWLGQDARQIFEETKKRLKGLELLDNADVELLGIYCDAVAKYRMASERLAKVDENGILVTDKDVINAAQSWARLVAGYAEKLGLTPTARARLARKKATREPADKLAELLDDVRDYVNHE